MRKVIGFVAFMVSLCSIPLDHSSSRAQVQQNQVCSQLAIMCGLCTNDNGGCWVYTGPNRYQCNDQPNSTCNPTEAQIICTATWYWPSSCNGVGCTPNTCCSSSGAPIYAQQTKYNSCIP
jgi:hypothetical protein